MYRSRNPLGKNAQIDHQGAMVTHCPGKRWWMIKGAEQWLMPVVAKEIISAVAGGAEY
ncbi:hypothetical protein [Paenibacillus sp. RC67]|uniref:hypothetical protein n=1 Tax=Paenibacillus sp. RC67 TaxID=3039392 RepID=UPI0024AD1AAD|nr:hypothetical protein [Paenibacillus sp. RC67]